MLNSRGLFSNQLAVKWVFSFSNISKAFFLFAGLLALTTSLAFSQGSGSHRVSIGIAPITVMSVSGDVPPLVVYRSDSVNNGFAREVVFYNLTTNIPGVTIEARLDSPMPEGTSLWLNGESTIGRSNGRSQLSASRPTKIISNIDRGLENNLSLAFRFVAGGNASDFPLQSRTVTIALVDELNGRRDEHVKTIFFGVVNTDTLLSDR